MELEVSLVLGVWSLKFDRNCLAPKALEAAPISPGAVAMENSE